MNVKTIQQQITAGNDFDGTAPAGTPTRDKDIEAYPPEAAGGLFDFLLKNPAEIASIELILVGQSSWSISKKDVDGAELVLWTGTTETSFITIDSDRMVITEEQLLLVRTTGATGALKARISVAV